MSGGWADADGRLAGAAAWYAGEMGWKVFPAWGIVDGRCECGGGGCREPKDWGKHPNGRLVRSGMTDASNDASVVRDWWGEGGHPEANVGIACKASGMVVVDADPRNGGLESLERLMDALRSEAAAEGMDPETVLPVTVEAETGVYSIGGGGRARGRHLYFKVEDGEAFKGNLGADGFPGIDIKHAGYTLAAPSRHGSGLIYTWREGRAPWEVAVADAPEALLSRLRKRPRRVVGDAEDSGFGVFDWSGEKLDVDAVLAAGVHEGERVVTLYKIACAIANTMDVSRGPVAASLKIMMRGVNRKHVFPPLDEPELDFQVDRAIQFVVENPKGRGLAAALSPDLAEWAAAARDSAGVGGGVGGGVSARPAGAGAGAPPAAEGVRSDELEAVAEAGLRNLGGGLPGDPDAVDGDDGGTPGRRSLSDIGNGRRIIDYAGEGIRYTPGVGWHAWNGEYWVPDSDAGLLMELAKRLPIWIASEVVNEDEGSDRAEALVKWAVGARARRTRSAAVADAQVDSRIRVPVSRWDSDPYVLGVRNGVINLKTGDLMAPSAERYITRQSSVKYTKGQTSVHWTEFLEFATNGDKELQRYLQLAAGYTLTGDRSHECLFLVYGPAGSGKSTFLEVLGTLLGEYYLPMESDVMVETVGTKSSTEYHMAQLMGRRMIGISEWPEGRKTKEDAIKRLTGDTMITGRHPGERPFQFESQAKLWVGTNVRPQISERAMWRRIRAINFNHVPEKPDPGLKSYLMNPDGALPAVLSWAVEGAVMLLSSGKRSPLAVGESRHVAEATEQYRISEDRFGMFLEEETKPSPGGAVRVLDLFDYYKAWIEQRGEHPPRMMTVVRMLEEKGERVSGMGNKVLLHDRVLVPRLVAAGHDVDPSWSDLVNRSR